MLELEARRFAAAIHPLLAASTTKQGFAHALREAARGLVIAARPRTEDVVRELDALVASALAAAAIAPNGPLGTFARERVRETAMLPWQVGFFSTAAATGYSPNGVVFDGTNDWLSKATALTGAADGNLWTAAFTFRVNTTGSEQQILRMEDSSNGLKIRIVRQAADTLTFQARRASGTTNQILLHTTSTFVTGQWYNVLMSRQDATNIHLYVDDANVANVATNSVAAQCNFSVPNIGVGATPGGSLKFNGELSDFWCDFNTYIDFSVEANRRKFFAADGGLVDKGSDGSTPTGTAPHIFLSGTTSGWETNKGTGGGFTLNGALGTSSSPPNGA